MLLLCKGCKWTKPDWVICTKAPWALEHQDTTEGWINFDHLGFSTDNNITDL